MVALVGFAYRHIHEDMPMLANMKAKLMKDQNDGVIQFVHSTKSTTSKKYTFAKNDKNRLNTYIFNF